MTEFDESHAIERAQRVIETCGGMAAVARICRCSVPSVYNWPKPRAQKGSGGVIPVRHQWSILRYALENGLDLRPEDFFPADLVPPEEDAA